MLGCDDDVLGLVRDYLISKNLVETEKFMMKEVEDLKASSRVNSTRKANSRLENMLESCSASSFLRNKESRSAASSSSSGEMSIVANQQMQTRLVAFRPCNEDAHGSANMPIYQTSTYAKESATAAGTFEYTRFGNPTRSTIQRQIAELEGGVRGFAFTTGMCALSCVSRLPSAGESLICCDYSYGCTYKLLEGVSRMGVDVRYVDLTGTGGAARLAAALKDKPAKLVMIECIANPLMRVCDIRALAKVTKEAGTLLCVDNTMMSPVLQRPLQMGADIVVESGTKFVSGHSDTMAGLVVVREARVGEEVFAIQNAEGTGLAPQDCFMLLRGIKTMYVRQMAAQQNAERVAAFLHAHPAVTETLYVGLKDHPDAAIQASQASGGGSVMCFRTGDVALSRHLLNSTQLFKITISFGSVTSLICMPGSSAPVMPVGVEGVRAAAVFTPPDLVRLSIGIEDADDLLSDLANAFATYKKAEESPMEGAAAPGATTTSP